MAPAVGLRETCGAGLARGARDVLRVLATLDKSAVIGKLGDALPAWPAAQRATFFGIFGF